MPQTFFDLNLFANMVAKLGNIAGEHVKFDMFTNNVVQFGHALKAHISAKQYFNSGFIIKDIFFC